MSYQITKIYEQGTTYKQAKEDSEIDSSVGCRNTCSTSLGCTCGRHSRN